MSVHSRPLTLHLGLLQLPNTILTQDNYLFGTEQNKNIYGMCIDYHKRYLVSWLDASERISLAAVGQRTQRGYL